MTGTHTWVTDEVDADKPSIARQYDYLLGGRHNLPTDRELARKVLKAAPGIVVLIRENRKFLRRAVRYALDQGIDQFLDLGAGIPSRGSVHEIVYAVNPEARIVYVDRDPVAVATAWELLADTPNATSVRADVLDVDATLADPQLQCLIDFTRPVALLLMSVLQFFPDEQVLPALDAYRARLAPGSLLAITTATGEGDDGAASTVSGLYADEFTTFQLRTREQTAALFGDFDIVEPGVVFSPHWRPDTPGTGSGGQHYSSLVGVARKPDPHA
jgi:O-methyltransferase involved in polyketide biosynthesis